MWYRMLIAVFGMALCCGNSATAQTPPYLAKTAYLADFNDAALVNGVAEWTIIYNGDSPAVLPLGDVNIAMQQVSIAGKEAVIGEFDGVLGLLIDRPGAHTCRFRWTSSGARTADSVLFDVRLPPCPVCSLEVKTPPDYHVVDASGKALLIGPALAGKLRTWRLQSAGSNQLQFTIGKATQAGVAPLVLAQVQTSQSLTPHFVNSQFDFQIEVLHHWLDKLSFDLAAELDPIEVTAGDQEIQSWEVVEQNGAKGVKSLLVSLYRPVRGLIRNLQIRCSSPLPFKGGWSCPGVKLRDAVFRGETIDLALHPDVLLENLQLNEFRLVDSRLAGTSLKLTAPVNDWPAHRPAAFVKTHESSYIAEQQLHWKIEPQALALQTMLDVRVTRGRLLQMSLALPQQQPPWEVQSVRVEPLELQHDWNVNGTQLTVTFRTALTDRTPAKIAIALRSDLQKPAPSSGRLLEFPDVTPQGQCVRFGGLGIFVDGFLHAEVQQTPLTPAALPDARTEQTPHFFYTLRGQRVSGKIRIWPQPSRLRVTTQASVTLSPAATKFAWHAAFEPLVGNPTAAIFFVSPPPPDQLRIDSSSQEARLQPLPELSAMLALGSRNVLEQLALQTCLPKCQWWRLTFRAALHQEEDVAFKLQLPESDPLREKVRGAVHLVAFAGQAFPRNLGAYLLPRRGEGSSATFEVPGLHFVGAERLQGEVGVHSRDVDFIDIDSSGMDELAADQAAALPGESASVFRARRGELPRLRLSWRARADLGGADRLIDQAVLHTYVEPHGRLVHHFRFRIWDWPDQEIAVVLPAASTIMSLKADQHWITWLTKEEPKEGIRLRLPMGRSSAEHAFEIVYATESPLAHWSLSATLATAMPGLPGAALQKRHVWHLPVDYRPLFEANYECSHAATPPQWASLADLWHAIDALGGPFWGTGPAAPVSSAGNGEWVAWETIPGPMADVRFTVVNVSAASMLGLICGVVALFLGWRIRVSMPARWRFRMLVVWLIGSLLCVIWLPLVLRPAALWLFAAGMTLAVCWLLRCALVRGSAEKTKSSVAPAASSASLIALALLPSIAFAQSEGDAVVVSAAYQGQVDASSADFVADYRLSSPSERSVATIALAGVELLEGTRLDDAPAYPIAMPKPKTGYRLSINGAGFHTLRIPFRVRIPPSADMQAVQFSVPRTIDNKLTLTLPAQASEIAVLRAFGVYSLTGLPDKTQTLTAELGPTNAVQVRWRQSNTGGAAVNIEVRESYFWDLRPPETTLLAVFDYKVISGIVSSLAIEFPDELDVRSVKVNESLTTGAGPQLQEWKIVGPKERRLLVQFARNLVGDVRLLVEFLPRMPVGGDNVLLRLPLPLRVKEKDFHDGILAYRVPAGAEVKETLQNISVLPASAVKEWQAAIGRAQGGLTNAHSFRRRTLGNAGLHLALGTPMHAVAEDLVWRIHPDHADLQAEYDISRFGPADADSANSPLLVELDTPTSFLIAQVAGADMLYWTRTEGRTQIWLNKAPTAKVRVFGWVKHPVPLSPGKKARYQLPDLTFRNLQVASRQVAINPAPGVAMSPLPDKALAKIAGQPVLAAGVLESAPVRPDVSTLTTASVDDASNLELIARLNFRIPFGQFRPLTLLIKDWPAGDLQFETPKGVRLQPLTNSAETWRLHVDPDVTRRFQLILRLNTRLADAGSFVMPHAQIVEANRSETFLALLSDNVRAEAVENLEPLLDIRKHVAHWPDADEVTDAAAGWASDRADWTLRLSARKPAQAAFKVLFCERRANLAGSTAWLHSATLLLHGNQAGVEMIMPRGADVVAARADERKVAPREKASGALWLPFAERSPVHRVQLWWRVAGENMHKPNLGYPAIKGVDRLAWICKIAIPEGYQLSRTAPSGMNPILIEDVLLREAKAYLELTKLVVKENGAAFAVADAFLAVCDQLAWRISDDDSPRGKKLHASLDKLHAEGKQLIDNIPRQSGSPSAAAHEVGKDAGDRDLLCVLDATQALQVELLADKDRTQSNRYLATEIVAVLFMSLWLISYVSTGLAAVLRNCWPEQLALLAGLGWLILGPSVAGVVLLVLAILGRILLMLIWLTPAR